MYNVYSTSSVNASDIPDVSEAIRRAVELVDMSISPFAVVVRQSDAKQVFAITRNYTYYGVGASIVGEDGVARARPECRRVMEAPAPWHQPHAFLPGRKPAFCDVCGNGQLNELHAAAELSPAMRVAHNVR